MAAVTTVLSAGVALAGLGMNIAQQQKAQKQKRKAEQAAQAASNQFKNVKEQNTMENVSVPTLGYELAQQGMERQSMAAIEAAKGAGAEGVIGSLPSIVEAGNAANLELGAQLGEKQFERDVAKAQIGADIEARRGMAERQFYSDQMLGAQQAAADAEVARQQAIAGMFESGGQLVSGIGGALGPAYGRGGGGRAVQGTAQNTVGIFPYKVPAGTTNTSATPAYMQTGGQVPGIPYF